MDAHLLTHKLLEHRVAQIEDALGMTEVRVPLYLKRELKPADIDIVPPIRVESGTQDDGTQAGPCALTLCHWLCYAVFCERDEGWGGLALWPEQVSQESEPGRHCQAGTLLTL